MDLEVDARPVAAVRIGVGLATVINVLEMSVLLSAIANGKVALPVMSWIARPTEPVIMIYLVVGVAAGLALSVGYRASAAALISVLANVGVFLWDQQTYSSHRFLATLLLAYLVFARSDRVWSLGRRHRDGAATVPWWPQLLIMTQLSVLYFFAALSKINPVFLSGRALKSWVRWPLPDQVFPLLAVGTILTEFFLAGALWFRPTRRAAALLGLGLHASIVVMMADQTLPLIAFSLLCVPLYALFLTRPAGGARSGPSTGSGHVHLSRA
ncbi:HTTM domain-containing protein [Microlunatus panaciterrae]|nr:HTTM domain-containing protein [Microlunatus panaciterrae]